MTATLKNKRIAQIIAKAHIKIASAIALSHIAMQLDRSYKHRSNLCNAIAIFGQNKMVPVKLRYPGFICL